MPNYPVPIHYDDYCHPMKSTRITPSLLIILALIYSLCINAPRLLAYFNVGNNSYEPFQQGSLAEALVRFFVLALFGWLVLYLNSRDWRGNSAKSYLMITSSNILGYVFFTWLALQLLGVITGAALEKGPTILFWVVYGVTLVIMFFLARVLLLQTLHQRDVLQKEQLARERTEKELQALKNQVNPHFLFNSLNTLNALIGDNPKAQKYVNDLSSLYRYILQSTDRDLISVEEELSFLEHYIHLLQVRYGEKLQVDIDIPQAIRKHQIPVLTLQLLVENAVKHNEISKAHPLSVKIGMESDHLVVSNPIRARKSLPGTSGKGLANINKRFSNLTGSTLKIQNSDGLFKVSLPLVTPV